MNANKGTLPGIFGLIGYQIQYSLSPVIHNHIFRKFGIPAVYGLFDIPPKDFRESMRALTEKSSGFNVTKPYKENVAGYLSRLSEEASLTGSVNLVKGDMGYNTDFLALSDLIEVHRESLVGKDCTIFGSGGAARTAAYMLSRLKMHITIVNRGTERAEKLENDLIRAGVDAHAVTLNPTFPNDAIRSEAVVNCISSPEFKFPRMDATLAVDFNYASRSGDFRDRINGKHSLITGEEILVSQAIHSQRIWNNIEPDFNDIMEVIGVQHNR